MNKKNLFVYIALYSISSCIANTHFMERSTHEQALHITDQENAFMAAATFAKDTHTLFTAIVTHENTELSLSEFAETIFDAAHKVLNGNCIVQLFSSEVSLTASDSPPANTISSFTIPVQRCISLFQKMKKVRIKNDEESQEDAVIPVHNEQQTLVGNIKIDRQKWWIFNKQSSTKPLYHYILILQIPTEIALNKFSVVDIQALIAHQTNARINLSRSWPATKYWYTLQGYKPIQNNSNIWYYPIHFEAYFIHAQQNWNHWIQHGTITTQPSQSKKHIINFFKKLYEEKIPWSL